MTRSDKKAREVEQLETFLHVMQLCPSSIIPGEAPDFVLGFPDGRRIGVEVVGVNATAQAATNALIRNYVIPRLERALSRLGVHAELQLMWKPGFDGFSSKTDRVDAFVEAVASFVAAQSLRMDGTKPVVVTEAEMEDVEDAGRPPPVTLPGELDYALTMMVIRTNPLVSEAEVQFFPTAAGEDEAPVKVKVCAKEKHLGRYRAALDGGEVWLLAVTGEEFEQNVVSSLVEAGPIETGFDHVYLLDIADETVTTLK